MQIDLLLTLLSCFLLLLLASIMTTKLVVKRRNQCRLRARVVELIPVALTPSYQREKSEGNGGADLLPDFVQIPLLNAIELSGWRVRPGELMILSLGAGGLVSVVLFVFAGCEFLFSLFGGLIIAAIPIVLLGCRAEEARRKLIMQLPNALDLMVSVLRSGHSIPQSLKAVASEMPQPCGREFGEILHRVSLGQPLPEAFFYTVNRYRSFELDLLRRALAIHLEVGGSLAELLDKTNSTLRDRIKLKRHIEVLTGPSRLSAIIVGLLPFVMAAGFYMLAPEYLKPLLTTRIGHAMLAVGLTLQISGYLIMRRMANLKV